MKKYFLLFAFLIVSNLVLAQEIFYTPMSNRSVSYKINAKLDQTAKMIEGTQVITFKNLSNDTIKDLVFHTYMNAFKNSQSTFFREKKEVPEYSKAEWGFIDVISMKITSGELLTPKLKYICPDDNNQEDQTLCRVELENPILPNSQVDIEVTFLTKLPRIVCLTGYEKGDFFMCGQWFVKLGVWQNHAWNAHQYHYNSQFYSDFGTYDVNITVPDGYLVGATGVMKKDITTDKGVRTFEFHAEDVVDFAFAASKRFCIMADTYKGKGIKLLYMPEHGNQAKRHLDAAKHAIDYMSETLSDYEYPNLTLVDLPFYATKASNAQYPMLITTTSIRNTPEDFHVFESQTIRQVVHNYFASIVASNQVEQAWLDEGITSYYEGKIMDKYYGDGSLFKAQSLILNNSDYIRTQYTQSYNPAISSLDCYSWTYPTYTFDMLTKGKASVMFQTLEGLLGKENFDDVMQKFYKKFSFSHPSGADLVALFNQKAQEINNDEIGKDLNWFFRQMLKSDAVCDYKLTSIVNRREGNQLLGYFQDGIEKIFKQDNEGKDFYTSSVYVQRMGDMIMPIDVVVTLENGQTLTFNWNGNGRCKEFVINANSKVISACIDPNQKIACDVNISNNSMTIENNSSPVWKYTSKFLFWLENIFQTISFFA